MIPRVRLNEVFYGIVDASELIIEHCKSVSDRVHCGWAGSDRVDDVMEAVIRPAVYLLDCALRPGNRQYLERHELTMLELIYVHDAFNNLTALLVRKSCRGNLRVLIIFTVFPPRRGWNATDGRPDNERR